VECLWYTVMRQSLRVSWLCRRRASRRPIAPGETRAIAGAQPDRRATSSGCARAEQHASFAIRGGSTSALTSRADAHRTAARKKPALVATRHWADVSYGVCPAAFGAASRGLAGASGAGRWRRCQGRPRTRPGWCRRAPRTRSRGTRARRCSDRRTTLEGRALIASHSQHGSETFDERRR
jgi:hypothetical protein